jgi:putative GTP pyrophosphokinase
MDFWASLEHQLRYKADVDIPDTIREKLRNSADQIYRTDLEMQDIYREIREIGES